jgi:hypothetical protein
MAVVAEVTKPGESSPSILQLIAQLENIADKLSTG